LKGVDLSKIEGHITAVNYACKYVEYDLLMAFDDPVKYDFPIDERLHTNIEYVKKHNLNCNGWVRKRHKSAMGLIRKPPYIFGYSGSLFCAINVLLHLGFKEIDVYGADMCLVDDYCHFYDTEPVTDRVTLAHYNRSFKRHKQTKDLIMSQLLEDEVINWK
jgi:hypothetical protein